MAINLATRRTVANISKFEGLGLHSGVPVTVTVNPGQDGIAFRLGAERWAAIPENVTDTSRCTKLGQVSTIEHLMSAFAGLEITDAEVELTAPEMPGNGGSSEAYVLALTEAGLETIGEWEPPTPFKRVYLQEGGVQIAIAKGSGHWRFTYDTGGRWPGAQCYESADALGDYQTQIAPARTFALEEELPMIEKMGLGQGLDETSALVLGSEGYINQPKFPDEPARHKLLDFIGDLYLAGVPIGLLNASATASGHRTNVAAAHILREHLGS